MQKLMCLNLVSLAHSCLVTTKICIVPGIYFTVENIIQYCLFWIQDDVTNVACVATMQDLVDQVRTMPY